MYCVYHGQDHPEGTPFTPEHVVPYGLGGSNQFAIQVCKKINNDIGVRIDAPFQKLFPVAYERFIRNLKSYSRQEPSVLFRGTTELAGQTSKIDYEITQRKKDLVIPPRIEREDTGEGTRYHIEGTPDQAERVIKDIERKNPGGQLVDESGNAVTRLELLARTPTQNVLPEIKIDWDVTKWRVAAQREFVKIALGTAHFFLGERYSRSSAADQLRRVLYATDEELFSIPIRGQIWPEQPQTDLPFLYHGAAPDHHLILLLHVEETLSVFVNLFGNMRAVIQITDDPDVCPEVKPNDGFIMTIDPKTRVAAQRTFEEFLMSLPDHIAIKSSD